MTELTSKQQKLVYELYVFNYERNAFKNITKNDLCLAVDEFNNT